jgi:hypothetical protein
VRSVTIAKQHGAGLKRACTNDLSGLGTTVLVLRHDVSVDPLVNPVNSQPPKYFGGSRNRFAPVRGPLQIPAGALPCIAISLYHFQNALKMG